MSNISLSSLRSKLRLKANNPRRRACEVSVVIGSGTGIPRDTHEPSSIARAFQVFAYQFGE